MCAPYSQQLQVRWSMMHVPQTFPGFQKHYNPLYNNLQPLRVWAIYTIISALEQYKGWHLPPLLECHTKIKWHKFPLVSICPLIHQGWEGTRKCSFHSIHEPFVSGTGQDQQHDWHSPDWRKPQDHSKHQIKANLGTCEIVDAYSKLGFLSFYDFKLLHSLVQY